jgi:hypothetical protein
VALDLLHEGCLAVLLCVEHCHDSNGVIILSSTHYGADLGLQGSTAQHSTAQHGTASTSDQLERG